MNRAQFMEQLKKLLSDISEAERLEALEYYENYFDDAGPENEEAVIRELGSPGKVAAIIKADLKESNDSYAEYTEYGYEDTRNREQRQTPGRFRRGYHAGQKKSNAGIVLILILLVFLSPFIKGAVGGILGIAVTIILLPFLLVFTLGAGALGLIIGAIACIAGGIGLCFSYVGGGILTIGIGCLLMTLGILFGTLLVWVAGRILPKVLRKVTDFCGNLFHKKEEKGV